MSINEISNCLDLSTLNVKTRLHRAKSILRNVLYNSTKNHELFEFGFSKCDQITARVMALIC